MVKKIESDFFHYSMKDEAMGRTDWQISVSLAPKCYALSGTPLAFDGTPEGGGGGEQKTNTTMRAKGVPK